MADLNGQQFLGAPGSQAVKDLGLSSAPADTARNNDEELKRKKLIEDELQNNASLTQGGILSPATMALFG